MEVIALTLALCALGALTYCVYAFRCAQRDLKEIATEAILASRANSAEELAQASAYAHQMKLEREAGQAAAPPQPAAKSTGPDTVQLQDGTILNVLRPFG